MKVTSPKYFYPKGDDSLLKVAMSAAERNSIPESEFGIPETRGYPMQNASHVRAALRFFNKAPEDKKPALMAKIREKAKQYGVTINDKSK